MRAAATPKEMLASESLISNATVGELVGQIYVETHFPAVCKVRMVTLVETLRDAYRDRIQGLTCCCFGRCRGRSRTSPGWSYGRPHHRPQCRQKSRPCQWRAGSGQITSSQTRTGQIHCQAGVQGRRQDCCTQDPGSQDGRTEKTGCQKSCT